MQKFFEIYLKDEYKRAKVVQNLFSHAMSAAKLRRRQKCKTCFNIFQSYTRLQIFHYLRTVKQNKQK